MVFARYNIVLSIESNQLLRSAHLFETIDYYDREIFYQ